MSNLDHEIQLERVVSTRSEEVVEQDVIETTEPREEMVEESPLPEGKVVDPELELSNPRENGHAKEVLNDAASTRGGLRGSETQHNGGPGVMQMELDQTASIPQLSLLVRVSIGIATMLCYFVGSASTTAVIVVIPCISRDFGISNLEAQWIVSSYSLAFGCTLLLAGRLADVYGRRLLFVIGMAMYAVCSVISPFLKDWVILCCFRAFAGLGLAIASPAAFGITALTFPSEREKTIAFSALALGNPLGAMVGTLLGGSMAIIGPHTWTYVYFLLAGISLFPIVIGSTMVPEPWRVRGNRVPIDWAGAMLITVAITLFAFSLTQSGLAYYGWKTPYIAALFAFSIVLFALFAMFEHHLEHHPESKISRGVPPTVKLSLFTRHGGRLAVVCFGTFAVFACVPGWIYLTSIYYQDYQGLSPLGNAIRLIPSCLSGMAASALVVYLLPRVHATFILSGGAFASGMASLLYAVEPSNLTFWECELLATILISFGADMGVGVGSVLISSLVEEDEQSVAGAIFQTAIQIASAFGVCLSSLVANEASKSSGSLLQGLRDAFGMTAAWAWIVPILIPLVLRTTPLNLSGISHSL